VLALATLQSWVNWPLSPDEITIAATACPPLATGGFQADQAALSASGWQTLFLMVFLVTAAVALTTVLLAYGATRRIGMPFVRRWTAFLGWGAAAAVAAAVAMMLAVPVATSGCEATESVANIPLQWVALRALVAAVHALVFYVLFSWLLSVVLGRVLRQGRWYDNHRVPFPYLAPRWPGARG
jgi:hypothetical protein